MTGLLLLVALPLSAQQLTYDTSIRLETSDGRVESVALPLAPTAKVIVEFRDAPMARLAARSSRVSAEGYRAAFQRFRADVASVKDANVRWEYFQTFNGVSMSVPRGALTKIRALPYVKAVHPDVEMHALADVTPGQNVKQVKADAFWSSYGTKGAGVVVAIIDTGIDYTHPALAGRVLGGYDFVNKDTDPMDDHFHGTHVAGIVAGNSAVIVGVAPEASLVAFKVLNANGGGSESDVLAAIERTVDPNGDGDTSDRVDVANLSLGGGGSPDDPLCVAVDNASALGVVFAISAGNSGSGHTIGSPGTARSAITVGAVDGADFVASFSSRGPNMKDLAVKPEVCAPGVSILSSLPSQLYGTLSGTSMASPHVAGVAALLRAVHHDWSPARIKAALVATAGIINSEVMATGGGRVDVLSAASAMIVADPPALSFGLDSPTLATWSATRQVRLTNRGTARATLTSSVAAKTGQKVTLEPASLTLDPGESRDVNVTVEITNATIATGASTFSGGGQIVFANSIHIPFGFTKAARATVTFDRGSQTTLWFGPKLFKEASPLSEQASEVLLAPATYDYFIFAAAVDEKSGAVSDERIVYREAVAIGGDMTIDVSGDAASHLITFAGRDENGATLSSKPDVYLSSGRLFLHPDWSVVSLYLPTLPVTSMRVSDLSLPKLAITEALYDTPAKHIVVVNHPLIAEPSGDLTLTAGGAGLATADLRLFMPPGIVPFVSILTSPQVRGSSDEAGNSVRVQLRDPGTAETTLRLALNAPAVEGYDTKVTVSGGADNRTWYTTPALVVSGGAIAATPAPAVAEGFDFAFGFGPPLIAERMGVMTEALVFVNPAVSGQGGESRSIDLANMTSDFYDPDGRRVVRFAGSSGLRTLLFDKAGTYRIENIVTGFLFGGVPRTTTLSLAFNPDRGDAVPPSFTAVALLDAGGRMTRLVEPNGSGALRFAVADFTTTTQAQPGVYQAVSAEATKVFYKLHGAAEWLPIGAVQQREESGIGIIYRVDLAPLAKGGRALYDIRIEAADAAGNTASLTYEPAFSVGTEVPPRGRAAAH